MIFLKQITISKFLKIICNVILITAISFSAKSQSIKDLKPYKVWISGKHDIKGFLYNVTDSSILVLSGISENNIKPIEYLIEDIKTLKIRRANTIKQGALWGLSIGAVSGIIAGSITQLSEGSQIGLILTTTAITAGLGTLIGTVITLPKKAYINRYNTDYYHRTYKSKLLRKTLKAQGFELQ